MRNAAIDVEAATARGIQVCGTDMLGYPTAELAWGLIIALMRHIPPEDRGDRQGRWQTPALGQRPSAARRSASSGSAGSAARSRRSAKAFGMNIIAWSQNLTDAKAAEHGARRVSKDELFALSDVDHHPSRARAAASRGLVGAAELARMKPTAYLVNTSRGPIVDEAALVGCLRARRIAGAALDVYDAEPIPRIIRCWRSTTSS